MTKRIGGLGTGSVREAVWRVIDRDPSIQHDLSRDLINVRALARYCSKLGIGGTEDAIISSVRRYPAGSRARVQYEAARNVVGQSSLSTKSHIVNIALSKGQDAQDVLPKLFGLVRYEKGETLRIVQGEESIKLLVDERNLPKMLELIPRKIVLNVHKGLAEIDLKLHPKAVETPGIMLVIGSELARNGINMYEIMSCVPEMLIFLDEKDVLDAYRVLFELCHPQNK
ncbi:hypothetical protein AUJ14_05030 [Candidatus Micrarchaeota archaeon CG1_02_55_22]|nr:MAG: hypothetical protein AUJ14_05030 [Candidatus Micrarchaeota archaeon CG1_02_55_22]